MRRIDQLKATYHATRSAVLQSGFICGVFLRYPLALPKALGVVLRAYVANLRDIWLDSGFNTEPDTKPDRAHEHNK